MSKTGEVFQRAGHNFLLIFDEEEPFVINRCVYRLGMMEEDTKKNQTPGYLGLIRKLPGYGGVILKTTNVLYPSDKQLKVF